MPNFSCHLPSIQACGRPPTLDRMASSTRVWCQSNQPMGLHWSLGLFKRSASESPCRAGFTKVFVFAVRALATTVCKSMLLSFRPDSLGFTLWPDVRQVVHRPRRVTTGPLRRFPQVPITRRKCQELPATILLSCSVYKQKVDQGMQRTHVGCTALLWCTLVL